MSLMNELSVTETLSRTYNYLVLTTEYLILTTEYLVLKNEYFVRTTEYLVNPSTSYVQLRILYSVPKTCFSYVHVKFKILEFYS